MTDKGAPATEKGADTETLPAWLSVPQAYEPLPDRDSYLTQSLLSVSSVLARLRLDDGTSSSLSPSAPVKILLWLGALVLNSLSTNALFTLALLAFVMVRAALLPRQALARVAATSAGAAALTCLVMLPAALLGQPRSPAVLGTKALVSTGLCMEVALTTPAAQLTGALRAYRVPSLVILTLDLALRSIVRLGEASLEALTALRLRSVGRNGDKAASMGGVGGVVLLKAAEAARQTHDAMSCRGFDGTYDVSPRQRPHLADTFWLIAFVLLVALFAHLQGA